MAVKITIRAYAGLKAFQMEMEKFLKRCKQGVHNWMKEQVNLEEVVFLVLGGMSNKRWGMVQLVEITQ